jgi:ribosome modulation factor
MKNAFVRVGIGKVVPAEAARPPIAARILGIRVTYSSRLDLDDVTKSAVLAQNAAIRSKVAIHLRRAYRLGYYASRYSESRDKNPYTRYGAMSRRLAWYQGYDDCVKNGDRPR